MRKVFQNRRAGVGLLLVVLIVVSAILAPLISPYDPNDAKLEESFSPPGRSHLLGTDRYGRDILSRIIYGARISLLVGIISQSVSVLLGVTLGALAGYFGKWIDDFVTWLANVVWSFPALLFVIAVTQALGRGIVPVYIAVALVSWVRVCRIVRAEFLSLRETEFVEAARALGAGNFRIIFRHILPNTLSPVIVVTTLGFATAIVAEAALSFLGLGVQPPTASWGTMLSVGRGYVISSWWMAIFPGLSITLAVLGFNLLGDGLRDALDPRLRGKIEGLPAGK